MAVPSSELLSQLRNEGVYLFRRHSQTVLIIDQHARRSLTGADALREFETDLAVGRGPPRLDFQFLAKTRQQFLSAPQHARQTAAHPQPRLPQRILLTSV